MKILVTGANGQLGVDLTEEHLKRGHTVVGTDVGDMDITDRAQVAARFAAEKPGAVIHCAAYTSVDAAEEQVEVCRKINAAGTENIAACCKEIDAKMVYISTDYVFAGDGEDFRDPDEERHPLNVYGQTKYEGELAMERLLTKYFIVRISWVFGAHGKNFVRTMLNLAKTHTELSVVDDQIGSPTYTRDISVLLADMAESERYGRYHATNEGICSWYEFAKEIFRQAGETVEVKPVSSEQFAAKAARPSNSRMSKDKLEKNGFRRLPPWQDALRRYLEETLSAKEG